MRVVGRTKARDKAEVLSRKSDEGNFECRVKLFGLYLCIEEAIGYGAVPCSRNVENRWMGMKPQAGDHWKVITGVQADAAQAV